MNQTTAAVLMMLTGTPLLAWGLHREASGRRVRLVVRFEVVEDEWEK